MKTTFLALTLSLAAAPAFAVSNPEISQICWKTGVKKVVDQAAAYGCTVDPENVQITAIDNRWWNPSKYLWFTVHTKCGSYDGITKLVQYYRGSCS